MKPIFFAVAFFLCSALNAQAPSKINYQGAARDAAGDPVVSKIISLKFDIHRGLQSGPIIYTDVQPSILTNSLGLFNTLIGTAPGLDTITVWTGGLFLEVSMDVNGASNFTSMGTQQLVSVPFALHARSVPVSQSGNVLTIGTKSFVLSPSNVTLTPSGIVSVTVNGNNDYVIGVPVPTITGSGAATVTGTYPNLSINVPAASGSTVQGSGLASVTSTGSTYNVDVPMPVYNSTSGVMSFGPSSLAVAPTLSFVNGVLVSGPATNSVMISNAVTISQGSNGIASVTGGPNYTISVPAPTLALSPNNQSLSISGGNTITLPTGVSPTIQGAGIASVNPVSDNAFTVNVPAPTYNQSNGSLAFGSTSLSIVPQLTLSNGVLTSGPSSNSVTLPNAVTVSQSSSGIASVVGGPNYTISVPAPTLALSSNSQSLSISGGNTITLPSGTTPTIQGIGIASVSPSTGNAFTVNVPAPTYNLFSGALTFGSTSVLITPALTLINGVLTSGPLSNSVTLPNAVTVSQSSSGIASVVGGPNYTISVPAPTLAISTNNQSLSISGGNTITLPVAANPTILGSGIASVNPTSGNSFTVDVPAPTYNTASGSLGFGTTSVTILQPLALSGGVLTSGPLSNSVALPNAVTVSQSSSGIASVVGGPNYTISVPAPTLALSSNSQSLSISGGNTITLPAAANPTILGSGIASVNPTSGNSFTVDVPAPTYNTTSGSLGFGTTSVTILQPLALSGGVLTSGPLSNSVALPNAVTVSQSSSGIATVAGGPNYTISVPAPTLALSANSQSLSISGGNTITLPTAVNPTITGAGIASVNPVSGNAFTVNVPVPSYNFANGSLAFGSNSVSVYQPLSLINGVLTSGPTNNSVTLPSQVTIAQGTGIGSVTGGPNYTISVPPQTLSLSANNQSLSISGGNTVVLPAAVNPTIQGTGIAAVSPLSGNAFTVDVPAPTYNNQSGVLSFGANSVAVVPTLTLSNGVLSSGPATNSIALPSPVTVSQASSGIATVVGGPNYTISVPALTLALSANSQSLSISGGNTITLPAAANPTILGTGIASVNPSSGNSFTVDVPAPTYNTASGSLGFGTTSVTILQPLALSGGVLTSGPLSNSVTLPNAVTVSQSSSGIASVAGGPNYTISVPAPTLALSANSQSLSISGGNTITLPAAVNPTIQGNGIASVNPSSGNSFTVDVPAPTYNTTSASLGFGTTSVTILQPLALNGAVLSSGPASNSVTLPIAVNPTILGTGIASVNPVSGSVFTVNVPSPSYNVLNGALSFGSTSVSIYQPLSVVGNVLISGPVSNSVNLPSQVSIAQGNGIAVVSGGPNYTISVPAPTLALSANNQSLSISGGNTVTLPTAANPTIQGAGIAAVTPLSGNSFTVSVPAPAYSSVNGALSFGTTSVSIVQPLSTVGNVLISGPVSNSVTLPSQVTLAQGSGVAVVSGGPNYTISVPAPTLAISANNQSLSISGGNTVMLPTAPNPTIQGQGLASVTPLTGNSFSVNVPVPTYNSPSGVMAFGTSTLTVAPTLSVTGNVLYSGPASNSVTLPNQVSVAQGPGIASVAGGPNYTVSVPAPAYNPGSGVLSFGTSSVAAVPTLTVVNNVLSSGPSTNSITLPAQTTITPGTGVTVAGGPNYTITSPPQTLSLSANNQSLSISSGNTVLLPTFFPQSNVTGSGISQVTSSGVNTFVVNTPLPTYNASSGLFSFGGTNTLYVLPTLSLSANSLFVGSASNSVSLGNITPWRQATGSVTLANITDDVGIGTATPLFPLDVNGGTTTGINVISSGTVPSLHATNSSNLFGSYAALLDGNVLITGTNAYNVFEVRTPSYTPLAITSLSCVGIGTSNPTARLQVSATNALFNIHNQNIVNSRVMVGSIVGLNNAAPYFRYYFQGSSNFFDVGLNANEDFAIGANATSNLVVTKSGNVGIGTTTPTTDFEVNGTIKMTDGNQGAGKVMVSDATGAGAWTQLAAPVSIMMGNTSSITVTANASVFNIPSVTYTKNLAATTLQIDFVSWVYSGVFSGGTSGLTLAIYVDGAGGTGSYYAFINSNTTDFVHLTAYFPGLAAGSHTVTIIGYTNVSSGTSVGARIDPQNLNGRILVKEQF